MFLRLALTCPKPPFLESWLLLQNRNLKAKSILLSNFSFWTFTIQSQNFHIRSLKAFQSWVIQYCETKIGCFSSGCDLKSRFSKISIYFHHFNQSKTGGRTLTWQLRKLGLNSNVDLDETATRYTENNTDNRASRYGCHLASPQQPAVWQRIAAAWYGMVLGMAENGMACANCGTC